MIKKMQFLLETLVALFYFPLSSGWIFVPCVVVLYLLFQWLYYSEWAESKRKEVGRQRFMQRTPRRKSFFGVPQPLFTKSVSIKRIVGQLFFLVLAAFAILPFLQLFTLPLTVTAINAVGQQVPVVEVAQRTRAGLINYERLKCYTLNYRTFEGLSHEIERCEPLYSSGSMISYLKHYPTVVAPVMVR